MTAVSSARDLSLEEPVIQDANPSDHSFPDGPCECETLELDPQPKIEIHSDVNHDDALSGGSSNAETEVSENGHDAIEHSVLLTAWLTLVTTWVISQYQPI